MLLNPYFAVIKSNQIYYNLCILYHYIPFFSLSQLSQNSVIRLLQIPCLPNSVGVISELHVLHSKPPGKVSIPA